MLIYTLLSPSRSERRDVAVVFFPVLAPAVVPDIPHMASTMEGRYGSSAPCEGGNSGQYVSAGLVLLPILSSRIVLTIGSSWHSFASSASMRAFFDGLDFEVV